MSNVEEIIAEFTRRLAAEMSQLSAAEIMRLAGSDPPKRRNRPAPNGAQRLTPATSISVDDIVNAIGASSEDRVSSDWIAEQLSVNRGDITRALKLAVAQGKVAQYGKARGTRYGLHEIRTPIIETAPPEEEEPIRAVPPIRRKKKHG